MRNEMQKGRSRKRKAKEGGKFCTQGEVGLHDGRHGHIAKMHQPIREWLQARCREEPSLPSSSLQKELHVHFGVLVSITHLNRIRAAHGLERQPARMGKKSGPPLST